MDRDTLATTVRARRLALGLSLREAAALAHVDHSLLGYIEQGKRNVTIDTLQRILEALGAEPPDDPHARLVARFAALVPKLDQPQIDALTSLVALFEQQVAHR